MEDFGKLVLRITVGGLMLFHGINKLMNWDATVKGIGGMAKEQGLPEFVAYGVFVGEVLAPALLMIGLFTRTAAVVLVINMAVAVWLGHAKQIFLVDAHGSYELEKQAFYLFGALSIALIGSGRMAVKPGK